MKLFSVLIIPLASYAGIFFISEADFNSRCSGLRNSDFAVNSYTVNNISNPSFLADQKELFLTSSYRNHFKDMNSGSVTVSHPGLFSLKIPAAITLSTISYGNFDDIETGSSYTPYEFMAVVSSGYRYKDVMAGSNIKYIHSSINQNFNSSGFIIDISATYMLNSGKASAAIGLFNFGMQTDDYYGKKEHPDAYLKTGVGYTLDKLPLKLMFQSDIYFNGNLRNAAGIEFDAKENLMIRAGYDLSGTDMRIGENTKSDQFAGLALGATVLVRNFGFDFSYMVNGGFENEFAMTMNLNLNEYIK